VVRLRNAEQIRDHEQRVRARVLPVELALARGHEFIELAVGEDPAVIGAPFYVTAKVDIAPAVAAHVGTDAIRMLDNSWAGSASVHWAIDYRRENGEVGTLANSNKYADEYALPDMVGGDVANDVAALQGNGFETVKITAVRVRTDFSPDYLAKRLAGVQMKRGGTWVNLSSGSVAQVSRGKRYEFRAVLRPGPDADGSKVYVPFTVPVANRLKRTVSVKLDGTNIAGLLDDVFGDHSVTLGPEPEDLDQLLFLLDDNLRNDRFALMRAYTSVSGEKKFSMRAITSPDYLVGGVFSFKLQAPALGSR